MGSLNKQDTSSTQQVGAKLLLNFDAHTEEGLLAPPLADAIGQKSYLPSNQLAISLDQF